MGVDAAFFTRDVAIVARDLLSVEFLVDGVGGRIVETEAYDTSDPASHSFRGPTPRTAVMFGPPGCAYVYRIYGLHWCVNFTCGNGAAVLIRAIEPSFGRDRMQDRRKSPSDRLLCSGPGRLSQALSIDGSLNAFPLDRPPFQLRPGAAASGIIATRRIGLSVARDVSWRFCLAGSPYLSKPPGIDIVD
jgi:DNA-3-methyladenine glycosylase